MLKSKMVIDVLRKFIDYFPELYYLDKQLPNLIEKEIKYTGAGVIYYFDCSTIDYKPSQIINAVFEGPIVLSEIIPEGADSSLSIVDGFVSCLDIMSRISEYPDFEIAEYTLVEYL